MPEYFRHFPQVKHSGRDVTDITKRVAFFDRVASDPRVFLPYTIEEGMRAEDVAYYYYDDPGFVWLVYLANNIVDPYLEWPMSQTNLEGHIEEKYLYACAECAINTTDIFDEIKAKFLLLVDGNNKKYLTSELAVYSSDYEEAWTYITLNANSTYMQSLLSSYYDALETANISYDVNTITDVSSITSAIDMSTLFGDMPEALRRTLVRVPNKNILKKEFNVLQWSRSASSQVRNIVYYVNKDDPDLKISVDTYNVNTSEDVLDQNFESGEWYPVRVYEYEFQLNEDRRHIFLIDRTFKNRTLSELKSLMSNG
jgi:hypothetical protein